MSIPFICTKKLKKATIENFMVNEKWNNKNEYVRASFQREKRAPSIENAKIDVEPVFGFLKANLRFSLDFRCTRKIEGRKMKWDSH